MLQAFRKDTYRVGIHQTNARGQLKLSALTALLQESAFLHADHLGFGARYMQEKKLAWVLASVKIHIEKWPEWNESIQLETWPRGQSKLYFLRDFLLQNTEGELIGMASTQWLLIDLTSRRPKVADVSGIQHVINENYRVFEGNIQKLPLVEKGEPFTYVTGYADFDMNQHVSSNRIMDIMLICFDLAYLHTMEIEDFQVNFIKEMKEEGEIKLKRYKIPLNEQFLIEAWDSAFKTIYFQSFIGFKPFV